MLRFSLLILALGIFLTSVKVLPHQPKTSIVAAASAYDDETADWSGYEKILGAKTPPPTDCTQASGLDVLVDKFHPLPTGYAPEDLVEIDGYQLRSAAASALNTIISEMAKDNLYIGIDSAYRSAASQQDLYNQALASKGSQKGNLTAAPPGYSEHQLGLAADLTLANGKSIYPSPAWDWLDKNAHRFGFILSYRANQTTLTGYNFEPWHWRYVGVDLATKIRNSDKPPQSFYKPISCPN